ncbi:hypothetical protein HN419_05755 [Candidatus Woesearchaeota archaeon]|jgi:hypothetical protein|nr:hypothetical protein [Candidatus Woesearchaeota archaeon]MBT7928775.1 hypothetical protein [Candidatus Peregrinibacteria bacterium]MBT3537625.1 hypothetical protein [Candidatus Woesearchaeota archaeon]MBT4698441.1 hypothetical protein [Candidatus Woesearchaeota archaeon]MBT4716650.1 hypothetical protein [Candidatus Woesearchaeota archaeon]
MKKTIVLLVLAMFMISMVPAAFAELTPAEKRHRAIAADLYEDKLDAKEDIRDEREDRYDESGKDVRDCMKICEKIGNEDCLRTCKARDRKEDILDKAEDIRDAREDRYDARHGVEKIKAFSSGKAIRLSEKEKEKHKKLQEARRERYAHAQKLLKEKLEKVKDKSLSEDDEKTLKEALFKAREEYKLSKKKYIELRQAFADKKKALEARKAKFETCEDDGTCEELKKKNKKDAKPYLLNTADMILEKLYNIRARVVSYSENLEHPHEILERLDYAIEQVESAKAEVEALDDDATREELIGAANTIKKAWKNVKHIAEKSLGDIAYKRVHNLVIKMSGLSVKFTKITEALDKRGQDVSDLQPMVDEYNERIGYARDELSLAKQALYDGDAEANKHLKNSHTSALAAHQMVKKIVREIRELRGTLKSDDSGDYAGNTAEESEDFGGDEE